MQRATHLRAGILMLVMAIAGAAPSAGQEEAADPPALTVAQYAFCTGIEEREPVGASATFPADVGRVYLWTEVEAVEPPGQVTHVWYYGDTKMTEVPLRIGYERTRTWSYKTILADWTGEWRVDIVNGSGEILKRASFTIGE